MSKTDSLHYQLCCDGAEWIKKHPEPWQGKWKYIAVEINVVGAECPDIWGFNGYDTIQVEVKVSRSDFLHDKKKKFRQDAFKDHRIGNYHYYLAPKGLIKEEELPENWGLLEWDNGTISKTKQCVREIECKRGDMIIISSILRREKFQEKIYNYRFVNNTIKSISNE